jgi:hypothetical protein
MSVLSWVGRTAWRPRQVSGLARWLLLVVAAGAVWPVTVVTGAVCLAARLRGWPAARLGRQAGWALPMAAVWIAAESSRGWRAITLDPVRDGGSGWPHLTVTTLFRTFLLVAPVTIPAGLALAALLWAWRIYAATTGTAMTGGATTGTADEPASAPVSVAAAQVPAARAPVAQAPVTVPAPRRETVPVTLRLDDIGRPGVTR